MSRYSVLTVLALSVFILCSCSSSTGNSASAAEIPSVTASPAGTSTQTPSPVSTPLPAALWLSPALPADLRNMAEGWGLPLAVQPEMAALRLDSPAAPVMDGNTATWVYALVAPFPTIPDGITGEEFRRAWQDGEQPAFVDGKPLLMDESTLAALSALLGPPAPQAVRTVPANELLAAAWMEYPCWAVVPFESLESPWKVLAIDGWSPLHKGFDPGGGYPLVASFQLQCTQPCPISPLPVMPSTNRDPSKLTTVVMTGVTAMVRATAYIMENKGVTYPGQGVGDWLRDADVAHMSNEIPFDPNCSYPNPGETKLQFCSSPGYIGLMEDVGIDVVELTGNHFADHGMAATIFTLDLYDSHGLPYFGGGRDTEDARKPLLLEHNGNKLAFIGCNPVGPAFAWASSERPGAAKCDYEYMTGQIRSLRAQGYLVITTFQYHEYYSPEPRPWQQADFRQMVDAGAVIVSGSQAHSAQAMELYNQGFIHYGLGNLFFDQMQYIRPDGVTIYSTRREFLDRHVFYDGRYIGTELLTAMLEDYASPRPMNAGERFNFLKFIFEASGWGLAANSPALTPTVIPTPLVIGTSTPTPKP